MAIFSRIEPYKRASNFQRHRSAFLEDKHRRLVRALRMRLLQWLPELRDGEPAITEAIDQATSFAAWDQLRTDHDIDTTQTLKEMSWGMRIASTIGALALAAAVYFFFYRFWGLMTARAEKRAA